MAYSSGVFSRLYDWATDRDAAIDINADRMDAEMDGMATGLSTALLKDGTQTVTANIPMSGFKFTGLAEGSSTADSATVKGVQNGTYVWAGTSGGSANAQTLTPSPAISALVAGQSFRFLAGFTNTLAATLAVSGLTAKPLVLVNGLALLTQDILVGQLVCVTYDGTSFITDIVTHRRGRMAQTVLTISTATDSTATTIPLDDTIPQSSEGDELTGLATTITPTTTTSNLEIDVVLPVVDMNGAGTGIIALFQDSGADAVAVATVGTWTATTQPRSALICYQLNTGSLTPVTLKLRYGPTANTMYVNRTAAGDVFSTANRAHMIIREILQ